MGLGEGYLIIIIIIVGEVIWNYGFGWSSYDNPAFIGSMRVLYVNCVEYPMLRTSGRFQGRFQGTCNDQRGVPGLLRMGASAHRLLVPFIVSHRLEAGKVRGGECTIRERSRLGRTNGRLNSQYHCSRTGTIV